VTFYGIQNLTGGVDHDTFKFLNGGWVAGNLDGAGGTNTLHYTSYTDPVFVDRQTGTATGVGGKVSNLQVVKGASSADVIMGRGGNVLSGRTTASDADPASLTALMADWTRAFSVHLGPSHRGIDLGTTLNYQGNESGTPA
jgi:hypothetical protein